MIDTQTEHVMAANVLEQPVSSFRKFIDFCLRVVRRFFKHNGVILASAVAYNTLLSIIPLAGILLVSLSQFFDRQWLLSNVESTLNNWLPGQATLLTQQVTQLLKHPSLFNGVSLIFLIFFSSIAFSITKGALREIFNHKQQANTRNVWFDLALPYIYILVVAFLLVVLSAAKLILTQLSTKTLAWLGIQWSLEGAMGIAVYSIGFFATSLLLSSLYMVMPGGRVPFRFALLGGVSATFLWEITRRILVWYFANVSIVNIVYGSLGTVIVVLLSFEIAAIIFLVGAAVIAELSESSTAAEETI